VQFRYVSHTLRLACCRRSIEWHTFRLSSRIHPRRSSLSADIFNTAEAESSPPYFINRLVSVHRTAFVKEYEKKKKKSPQAPRIERSDSRPRENILSSSDNGQRKGTAEARTPMADKCKGVG